MNCTPEHSVVPTGVGIINPYTQGADISDVDPITNKSLGVYETNTNNKVVKFKLISLAGSDIYTAPALQSAVTSADGTKVILSFDKAMADPVGKHTQFSVVSGGGNAVTSDKLGTDTKIIELTVTTPIIYVQTVTVGYSPCTIGEERLQQAQHQLHPEPTLILRLPLQPENSSRQGR